MGGNVEMKWLGWLGRLIITIIVVCLLTVMTTGYVVNYYIEHMLSRYHISMTDGGPSVTDIMKGLVGIQGSTPDSTKKDKSELQQNDSLNSSPTPPTSSTSPTAPTNEELSNGGNDLPPATGGANSDKGNDKSKKENVVVTPDDLLAKKDGIEAKDKEAVFAILMSKLPQNEMQKMSEYLEDGLTESEVLAIEQMLSKYLDKTEYAKVMEILKK
jgi:hypothetical protein